MGHGSHKSTWPSHALSPAGSAGRAAAAPGGNEGCGLSPGGRLCGAAPHRPGPGAGTRPGAGWGKGGGPWCQDAEAGHGWWGAGSALRGWGGCCHTQGFSPRAAPRLWAALTGAPPLSQQHGVTFGYFCYTRISAFRSKVGASGPLTEEPVSRAVTWKCCHLDQGGRVHPRRTQRAAEMLPLCRASDGLGGILWQTVGPSLPGDDTGSRAECRGPGRASPAVTVGPVTPWSPRRSL